MLLQSMDSAAWRCAICKDLFWSLFPLLFPHNTK